MGAGKTSFAKKLAAKLGLPFFDTDIEIEKQEEKSISELFTLKGEHYFRSLELKLIENLPIEPTVISCGGGLPCYYDNILKLKERGRVIYLNTDFEFIYSRIGKKDSRPLIQQKSKEEIKKLFTSRQVYYQLSDIEMDNSLSLDDLNKLLKNT